MSELPRAQRAMRALQRLRYCGVQYRRQAYDEWLGVATPGEVRKYHQGWMGKFPQWAMPTNQRGLKDET